MPEDKYEELKRVIQEAVPEIMELKFGCEIGDGEFNFIIYRETKKNFWVKETNARGSIYQFPKPLKISIILGRPIRLADVLLTIKKRSSKIMQIYVSDQEVATVSRWNLSDDNLDNQSDETKMFLYQLLVK